MTLSDPAVLFRKGPVLPAGTPRTLIVLGAARGGTTMIAQMLHDLGIFMGSGLGSTCQDPALSEISRALFHGRIDLGHPAIEQLLRQRDRDFDVWGWKFPPHLFEGLYAKTRKPHVIAVFRDPVAIATRESVSQACGVEPCFRRALEQLADIGDFVQSTAYPCLAVSYERGLARKPELIDALVDFAGTNASPDLRQRAALHAQPGSLQYLKETQAREIEGALDRVDTHVAGWLRYPHQPGRRVGFAMLVDGVPIHRGEADRFRADLAREFGDDGCCSFEVAVPDRLLDGRPHRLGIQILDGSNAAVLHEETECTFGKR